MNKYYLYILKCADSTLYTGITTNLQRRVQEHNANNLGAKYTRGRRPVELVYFQEFNNRSEASKEESLIKKLTRLQKMTLIKNV